MLLSFSITDYISHTFLVFQMNASQESRLWDRVGMLFWKQTGVYLNF